MISDAGLGRRIGVRAGADCTLNVANGHSATGGKSTVSLADAVGGIGALSRGYFGNSIADRNVTSEYQCPLKRVLRIDYHRSMAPTLYEYLAKSPTPS